MITPQQCQQICDLIFGHIHTTFQRIICVGFEDYADIRTFHKFISTRFAPAEIKCLENCKIGLGYALTVRFQNNACLRLSFIPALRLDDWSLGLSEFLYLSMDDINE